MSDNGRPEPPPLAAEFYANQRAFPREQLRQYAGQYVAWSLDGSRILASGETLDALEQKLFAAGLEPNRVVSHYVPPPDAVLF